MFLTMANTSWRNNSRERGDSLRASLSKNVFHCFACQAQGNVLEFVAAMEKCSIREAACRLQRWFGVATSNVPVYPAEGAQKGELVREKKGTILRCLSP